MEYKKKNMNSFNLHVIKTDRFKKINVSVIFRNKIKKEEITITNFLSSILLYSTKKFPNKKSLAIRMEDLYAADFYSSCHRIGNFYNVDFNLSMLDDKYSEDGMLEETLSTLSDIIFDPNVTDGKFDSDSFNVIKEREKAQIERFREDSKKYSMVRMLESMNPEAPFAYNCFGYMDDLEKIDEKNLYDFYEKFIRNSIVDIFVVGNVEFSRIEKIVKEKFKFRTFRNNNESPILSLMEAKSKPLTIFESDSTNQAKLSIGCVIDKLSKFERDYVLSFYNLILGGTADSKFFKNIREKYSLCYYINSFGNKVDNLFIITSGITKDNFSKMLILINKEMDDMRKGLFDDIDIDNAKNYFLSSIEEIEDKPGQIIGTYYAMDILKTDDIEKRKEEIQKVTREDIIKVAKKIHIDTIYLLGGDRSDKKGN